MPNQPQAAVHEREKRKAPDDSLIIYFFDSSSLRPVEVEDGTEVSLRWKAILRAPVKLPLHKAGQENYISGADLKNVLPEEATPVEIQLANGYQYNCQQYESTPVSMVLSNKEPMKCRRIPAPLTPLEETCTLKVRAYDCGSVDFIENAKFFLDNVEVRVSSSKTGMPSHDVTARFQSVTHTGKTRNGEIEFLQLPKHQMYRIEVRGPEGYISDSGSLHYRYVCCSSYEELVVHLRPCGRNPERTVIFVRQECSGIRWMGNVEVAGQVLSVNDDGILRVPPDLSGLLEISAPGKSFSPAVIDARDAAEPVTVVSVAEQALLPTRAARKRFRFEDEDGIPFRGRPVVVVSSRGEQKSVVTDDDGFFDAEEGAMAYAEAHESCPAVEPLLLSSVKE